MTARASKTAETAWTDLQVLAWVRWRDAEIVERYAVHDGGRRQWKADLMYAKPDSEWRADLAAAGFTEGVGPRSHYVLPKALMPLSEARAEMGAALKDGRLVAYRDKEAVPVLHWQRSLGGPETVKTDDCVFLVADARRAWPLELGGAGKGTSGAEKRAQVWLKELDESGAQPIPKSKLIPDMMTRFQISKRAAERARTNAVGDKPPQGACPSVRIHCEHASKCTTSG